MIGLHDLSVRRQNWIEESYPWPSLPHQEPPFEMIFSGRLSTVFSVSRLGISCTYFLIQAQIISIY